MTPYESVETQALAAEPERALEIVEAALADRSEDPRLHALRADACLRVGRVADAFESLRASVARANEQAGGGLSLELVRRFVERNPSVTLPADLLLVHANDLFSRGRYAEAAARYRLLAERFEAKASAEVLHRLVIIHTLHVKDLPAAGRFAAVLRSRFPESEQAAKLAVGSLPPAGSADAAPAPRTEPGMSWRPAASQAPVAPPSAAARAAGRVYLLLAGWREWWLSASAAAAALASVLLLARLFLARGDFEQVVPAGAGTFRSVRFCGPSFAMAVGDHGAVYRLAGGAWRKLDAPTTADLLSVSVVSPRYAWIVGRGGTMLRFEGDRFLLFDAAAGVDLTSVSALTESEAWAVGARGTILRWDGSSWTRVRGDASARAAPRSLAFHLLRGPGLTLRGAGEAFAADFYVAPPAEVPPAPTPESQPTAYSSGAPREWGSAGRVVERPRPPPSLLCVTALDAGAAVAVGERGTVVHWNGLGWREVSAEAGDSTPFTAVAPVTGGDWLLARRLASGPGTRLYRWDLERLTPWAFDAPRAGIFEARAIRALSSDTIYVAGVLEISGRRNGRVLRVSGGRGEFVGGRLPPELSDLDAVRTGELLVAGAGLHRLAP